MNPRTIAALALSVLGLLSLHAHAAPADAQAVTTIVVPYAPGGPLDTTARALAEAAKGELGTIIIDNRPGAGGNIGLGQVARAAADGKTLGIAAVATIAINPWLYQSMPYDPAKDFAGVTLVARIPNVLVMNSDAARAKGIESLQDLIAYARQHPGKLNYGSGGNGSAGHLAGELFKNMAGIDAVHVPYNGASPAQLALLSREVDFNFDNLAAAAPNIRAGKLTPLAVTTLEPSSQLPAVPTMAATLPGFAIDTWWGLVVPAGTPEASIARLNRVFTEALGGRDIAQRFEMLLATPAPSTAADFDAFMHAERERYAPIVKATGAQVD
ncbi:tripartite tricarboxylate transporter substrate binding protein [Corticibacter populi]|uniref:Tripartite tricarboxylate transporter substrate binding protein n=1 Tax=Corticibacter populi TaxID=1550736 RepID=A0A3M6R0R0_9BURK|nr:tripartite tricarboxylate transporter substrate binding protein [Corticibacter populi]RMX08844.1 tripartite tricarboxylate transporter substrate binding protein [Corticibacter populi]